MAFLILNLWGWVGWIASGDALRTPVGTTAVPGYMKAIAAIWQPVGLAAGVVTLNILLIKPLRATGRISSEGVFSLAFVPLVFWMPMVNILAPHVTYNSHYFNLGSWGPSLPVWLSANGSELAIPLLWAVPVYLYIFLGGAVLGDRLMHRAKTRWLRLGNFGLVGGAFLGFTAATALFRLLIALAGVSTLPAPIRGATLFAGRHYQLPAYEAVLWGAAWTAFACLIHFRNPAGRTLPESGIDDVQARPVTKTLLRFLAVNGVLQLVILVLYVFPTAVATIYSDEWSPDVASRSYLTNFLCGLGTDHACPGAGIPFPKKGSAYINVEGKLVVPDGATIVREDLIDQHGG